MGPPEGVCKKDHKNIFLGVGTQTLIPQLNHWVGVDRLGNICIIEERELEIRDLDIIKLIKKEKKLYWVCFSCCAERNEMREGIE